MAPQAQETYGIRTQTITREGSSDVFVTTWTLGGNGHESTATPVADAAGVGEDTGGAASRDSTPKDDAHGNSINLGAIISAVAASIILLFVLIFCCRRKRRGFSRMVSLAGVYFMLPA